MRRFLPLILAVSLLVQPATIAVQVLAASRWPGDFSLVRNTISDLGTARSPWHAAVNGSFLALGAALAVAGVLLALRWGGVVRVGGVLLTIAGLSSVLVGFVPLDVDSGLHAAVATPVFLTQPVAVLLVAWGLRRGGAPSAAVGALGALALAGAVAFGASIITDSSGGLAERICLWSCHLAWFVLGIAWLRRSAWEDLDVEVRA